MKLPVILENQYQVTKVMYKPLEQDKEYIKLSLQVFKDALSDLWKIDAYNEDKWNTELGQIEKLFEKIEKK